MSNDKATLQPTGSISGEKPEKGDTQNSQTTRNDVSIDGQCGESGEISVHPPVAVPPEPPPTAPQKVVGGERAVLDTVSFT